MKRLLLLVAVMAIALGSGISARADTILLGEDEVGDWGVNTAGDNSLAPIGDALGADLKSASVENDAPGHVKFILGVTNLPEIGGTPETIRYNWAMKIGSQHVELDGKYTNYSRGACDPTSGKCLLAPGNQPDPSRTPRDPGAQPFLVRGNCAPVGQVNVCEEFDLVHATFDTAADTITIPLDLSRIPGVNGCTNLTVDVSASFPDGNIVAVPSAFFSQASLPYDSLLEFDDLDVLVC